MKHPVATLALAGLAALGSAACADESRDVDPQDLTITVEADRTELEAELDRVKTEAAELEAAREALREERTTGRQKAATQEMDARASALEQRIAELSAAREEAPAAAQDSGQSETHRLLKEVLGRLAAIEYRLDNMPSGAPVPTYKAPVAPSTGLRKRERRVGAAEAVVDETLDPSVVRGVVRSRMRDVNACYEIEAQKNPKLAGKVDVSITVRTDGRVKDLKVASNSTGNNNLASCIKRTVKRWRFPVTRKPTADLNLPFIFTSPY